MIVLETLKLDPRTMSREEIQTQILNFKETGHKKLTVEWFDLTMDQSVAQELYLPLVQYAQT